jgi:uncharacterized protein (TIGR02757 family)
MLIPKNLQSTRKYLDQITNTYTDPKYLTTDPILFCYRYSNKEDIEIIGFLAAMFSYGNVSSIQKFLESLFSYLQDSPRKFLETQSIQLPKNIYYRFQTNQDIKEYLLGLQILLRSAPSLEPYFINEMNSTQLGICNFQTKFLKILQNLSPQKKLSNGLRFLVGTGAKNSANKRYHMFLRWMVRDEFPDLGIYQKLSKKNLLYPLDTHIVKLTKILGLSNRKSINAKMTEEITNNVKQFNREDPLLYDFPLSRLGILKLCKTKYEPKICNACTIQSLCTIYAPYTQSHP